MTEERWDAVKQALSKEHLEHLAAIPTKVAIAAFAHGDEHPLVRLLLAPNSSRLPAVARLTNKALKRVERWLATPEGSSERGWWSAKLNALGKDGVNAGGALAEIRAFGAMLSTAGTVTSMPVRPHHGKGKAADFCIEVDNEAPVHVEACVVRMNDDERARHVSLDERESLMRAKAHEVLDAHSRGSDGQAITASAHASWTATAKDGSRRVQRHDLDVTEVPTAHGEPVRFAIATRFVSPQGPLKDGDAVHTNISRILGRKRAGQVPDGHPGILWMDLCDPEWSMSVKDTQPVELCWKEVQLALTRGIWHSFFGCAGITPTFERELVGLELGRKGRSARPQRVNGRFRGPDGRGWSAAVLRCVDGLVIFEHPNPLVPLPFPVLQRLSGLPGYAPGASFHRHAVADYEGLNRRLRDVEQYLRFLVR